MVIPWVGIPLANFIKRCDANGAMPALRTCVSVSGEHAMGSAKCVAWAPSPTGQDQAAALWLAPTAHLATEDLSASHQKVSILNRLS
jgi:hypothetical protein